jgi:Tfp pilus assembly protein PilX
MDKRSEIQQGFVSIITASLIMIITTLIVIGFSQLMQRELRQSLDRQLNSQALYAAETGLNDLYDRLQKGELTEEENLDDCSVDDWPNGGIVNPDSSNEAAYTCILYDQTPSYLEFNNGAVTTQQSKIFPIQPKSNNLETKVKTLTFSWSGAGGNTNLSLPQDCPAVSSLPPNPASLGVPILRVDLVKVPLNDGVNAISLSALTETDTSTFFLYPKTCGASSGNYDEHYSIADKGKMIEVNCANTNGYACKYEMNNMHTTDDGSNRYFARIKSIYNDADVRIEGNSTASGNGGVIEFVGAQVIADVTGKSNDVLRRIKVQIGNPGYPIPEFVVQGLSGVCKGIEISPPNSADTSLCP